MSNVYPSLPGPGINPNVGQYGTTTGEWTAPVIDDVLASGDVDQVGCTLAPGQGVVKAGSLLYTRDDGLWVKSGETGAGDLCHGVLREARNTGTSPDGPTQQGNCIVSGSLKNSVVQAAQATDGTELNARVDEVLDTYAFHVG